VTENLAHLLLKTQELNGDLSNFRGQTFIQIRRAEILVFDCRFCIKRKECKNPNSRRHNKPLSKESRFYTCAVYKFDPTPEKQKPKTQEPKFNPERLAEYDWILKSIRKKEEAKDAKAN
jgi:hypothetical protein